MTEAYIISPSASVESQKTEGNPAAEMQNGGSDAESPSSSIPASVNERNEMQNSETLSSQIPLNDDDDDEFSVTDIVEQVLLFGCGVGSSLCCKFFQVPFRLTTKFSAYTFFLTYSEIKTLLRFRLWSTS